MAPPDAVTRTPGLRGAANSDLRRLREHLQRGTVRPPLSRAGLLAVQLGSIWGAVEPLRTLDANALLVVLDCVLAERGGPAHATPRVTLVWSGPEGRSGWSRPTAAVVRDLFAQAQHTVLLAGYSFDHGSSILEPLHTALRDRGVQVSLYLHIERASRKVGSDDAALAAYATSEIARFLTRNWPFGPPYPEIYYDPRTLRPDSIESMHAKCIVIDERKSLIGSANFTDRGQSRNIEIGTLIEDEPLAQALCNQLRSATAAGVFVRWQPTEP